MASLDPTAPADRGPGTPGHSTGPAPDEVLDCAGKRCPLPVIALARRLVELPVGAVLRIVADDPAAANDIAAWCRMRGHEYLGPAQVAGVPAFDVRRSG
jgi:tRNA 2-thiouridine synthesizing protein A